MLMSPDMSGVSGGGNTNTNNSQINQSIANTLGLNTAGTNANVPMVSTIKYIPFPAHARQNENNMT